ncbi:MAG TPA: cellulose biosynthesis protein BcsS [Xanthobacteraceae bacterium]|nr:cellulose biosynthesis protein BcsS [Xanthobacteraceae bacterium]
MPACLVAALAHAGLDAGAPEDTLDALTNRLYFYSGLDVARDSAYAWAGTAWAPFAPMDRDGFRLRVQGGGGRYRYRTDFVAGGWNMASTVDGELLAGWQFLSGGAALALYGGINVTSDLLDHPDPSNPDQGTHFGGKAVAELFLKPAAGWVATAAASFSTANLTTTLRGTLARQFGPVEPGQMELGVETSFYSDRLSQEARLGLFVAAPLLGRTFRLAGGLLWSDDSDSGLYGTLSLYVPF